LLLFKNQFYLSNSLKNNFMGLLETIGKFTSGLFAPSMAKAVGQWEKTITLDQIEAMEKRGIDVTEMKERYYEQAAAEEEIGFQVIENLNAIDISKLEEYKSTPRNIESPFVIDVAALNNISDRRGKNKIAGAPLVYGAVMQAHHSLYVPGDNEGAGIVFIFALDDAHRYDIEWLTRTVERILLLKKSPDIPSDSTKFIKTLCEDQSYFCFKIGDSLNCGADAWCVTFVLDKQQKLPFKHIPINRIIPFLMLEHPIENRFAAIKFIPAQYYTK
jgi:hypothetical protein